jgi:hypothetical protein
MDTHNLRFSLSIMVTFLSDGLNLARRFFKEAHSIAGCTTRTRQREQHGERGVREQQLRDRAAGPSLPLAATAGQAAAGESHFKLWRQLPEASFPELGTNSKAPVLRYRGTIVIDCLLTMYQRTEGRDLRRVARRWRR